MNTEPLLEDWDGRDASELGGLTGSEASAINAVFTEEELSMLSSQNDPTAETLPEVSGIELSWPARHQIPSLQSMERGVSPASTDKNDNRQFLGVADPSVHHESAHCETSNHQCPDYQKSMPAVPPFMSEAACDADWRLNELSAQVAQLREE